MLTSLRTLYRGLAQNFWVKCGYWLTVLALFGFLFYEFLKLLGWLQSAALGLFLYMLFPAIFLLGIVLIIFGWFLHKKSAQASITQLLKNHFPDKFIQPHFYGSQFLQSMAFSILVLTLLFAMMNLRMFHFMEESYFCGTACHKVMNPEWQTYRNSAHAHVDCVECHVGDGVSGFLQAKMDGTRQLIMMVFNTYARPVPAPVHHMRPAREVCERCHWPDKFYGQRLVTHITHQMDSLSTPTFTTLNVKVDVGANNHVPGAHWHVGAHNQVIYTSVDRDRLQMINVRARQTDGSFKEWKNQSVTEFAESEERVLDCIDCHNRATHVYRNPERVVDELIASGVLDRNMPFIKQQALSVITSGYPTQEQGIRAIQVGLQGFYQQQFPQWLAENPEKLETAIMALQQVYATNIHQYMNIDWGSYPNHIGHERNLGCFRCHNENLIAADGAEIDHDCTLCHSILANESDDPYAFLKDVDWSDPEAAMHNYLQQEFFDHIY